MADPGRKRLRTGLDQCAPDLPRETKHLACARTLAAKATAPGPRGSQALRPLLAAASGRPGAPAAPLPASTRPAMDSPPSEPSRERSTKEKAARVESMRSRTGRASSGHASLMRPEVVDCRCVAGIHGMCSRYCARAQPSPVIMAFDSVCVLRDELACMQTQRRRPGDTL